VPHGITYEYGCAEVIVPNVIGEPPTPIGVAIKTPLITQAGLDVGFELAFKFTINGLPQHTCVVVADILVTVTP
jgi:hypothetical protein